MARDLFADYSGLGASTALVIYVGVEYAHFGSLFCSIRYRTRFERPFGNTGRQTLHRASFLRATYMGKSQGVRTERVSVAPFFIGGLSYAICYIHLNCAPANFIIQTF
jgi:hypothetical protein